MPTSRPTPICRAKTRTTTQNVSSACVASSINPSISAIPTGSLAPDSPSRIVSVRPSISRSPRTENMTAGSVGATAAPIRPAVIQPIPSAQWAKPATSPAIAKVPGRPSSTTGTAAARKRRRPIDAPPSKRITTSAPTGHELDRVDGERQPRNEIRRERGGHQQHRGERDREALHEARIRKSLPFAHSGHNSAGKTDRADAEGLSHPALRTDPRPRGAGGRADDERRRRRGARVARRQRDESRTSTPRAPSGASSTTGS